jgi:uncharacterized protein (TIGR00251 family)
LAASAKVSPSPGIVHPVAISARVNVRLQPHAGRDELVAIRDGVLVVRVAAPALDGRANRSLCRLLAKRLGVAPSHVTLVRGARSRDKVVAVDGLDQDTVDRLLTP